MNGKLGDAPRVLQPGRDISHWPRMKVARAAEMLNGLGSRIETWSASGALVAVATLEDSGERIEFHLRVQSRPPIGTWAMDLGEGIHQLRASLDGLAWELAHIDGASPAAPEKIYFPIKKNATEFTNAMKGPLRTIPSDARVQMEKLQPYHPHNGYPFLKAMNALDIQDKHRSLLSGRVSVAVDLAGLRFDARRFAAEESTNVRIEMNDKPQEIQDGSFLGALRLPGVLTADEFETTVLAVGLEFEIEFDGHSIPLPQIQSTFPQLTLAIHNAVLGVTGPDDPTEWTDLQISSHG